MANNGFTKIRKGLLGHIEAGHFTAIDLGVYVYLHMRSNWRSGICWTNAKSVATGLGTPHATVKQVFRKLREKKYIDYPEGCGSRANYPVAIINAEPTLGILKGARLIGFSDSSMRELVYDISTAEHPEDILRTSAQHPERIRLTSAEHLVNIPLQDLQDFKTDKTLQYFQNEQHEQSAGGAALSDQGEIAPKSVAGPSKELYALSDFPTTKEEQDRFKGLRLGEWEKGVLTRMVDEGAWRKRDVDLAIRIVLESHPDGVTFHAFQDLVEAANAAISPNF